MATQLNVPKVLRLLLSAFCLLQTAATVGAFERILCHGGPVKDVALAPQGDLQASVSFDYSVVLWDTADFHEKYRVLGHNVPVATAAFSPDEGHSQRRRSHAGCPFAHHGKIARLTISPDFSKLATASWDGELRIWSLETMRPKAELRGHIRPVQSAQDGMATFVCGTYQKDAVYGHWLTMAGA